MFNYLSNKIESNIKLTFITLLLFHALVAIFLFLLASSEYFSNFHNGEGLWNFASDSFRYHQEAVESVHFLQDSEWASWFKAHWLHAQVRFISLAYWLTGYEVPIVFEVVNGFVWTASIVLIYRSSKVLFENNTVVPILTVLFFLQPSVLISSTQLLRDPFQILSVCFLCYGWVLIFKTKLHLRAVLCIAIGSLIYISMRQYLGLIMLTVFSSYLVYLLLINKITLVNAAIIILSLLFTMYINLDKGKIRGSEILLAETDYTNEFRFTLINTGELLNQSLTYTPTVMLDESKLLKIQIKDETAEVIEYLLMQMEQIEKKYSEPRLDKRMRSLRLKEIKSIEHNLVVIKELESNVAERLEASPTNDKKLESLYASIKNSKELLLIQHNQLLINEEEWQAKKMFFKFLDMTSWRILELRSGFTRSYPSGSESTIDPILQFDGFEDAIAYLPRALQVSFLSPFPVNWIEKGQTTGRIGRLLSGLEMLVWYVVIIGFIYEVVTASSRAIPLIPVLILATFIIVLIGYAVPNMGAIYRMRQDQIIPFYLIGIYGVYSITNRLKNKRSVDS